MIETGSQKKQSSKTNQNECIKNKHPILLINNTPFYLITPTRSFLFCNYPVHAISYHGSAQAVTGPPQAL